MVWNFFTGQSGGGMTGPPQAGTGTQSSGSGMGSMNAWRTATVVGGIAQAATQIQAARRRAQVARDNAKMMKLEARYQELRGRLQKNRLMREAASTRESQRAAYAGAGVNPDVGTPAEVGEETWERAEEDADMIDLQVKTAASKYRGRAAMERYRARTAMPRGYTRAGTSLLSTYQRVMSREIRS